MFKKLDIKSIFIIALAAALLLSLWFRPSKPINRYEDEIKKLNEENKSLLSTNDSLKLENIKINDDIKKLLVDIDKVQDKLDKTNDRVKDLENGKIKVSGHVKSLDADGVAKSLTEYLNKKTK